MAVQDRRVPTLFIVPLILFFVASFFFIALLNGRKDLAVLSLLIAAVLAHFFF